MPPKTPKSKTPARKKEKETEKQQSMIEEVRSLNYFIYAIWSFLLCAVSEC